MNVFVTGSTGVLGRRLVSKLADCGHDVIGLARDEEGASTVERRGGDPVRGDVLEAAALREAAGDRDIGSVVHLATKLPAETKTDADYWRRNDRVRLDGARNLVEVFGDRIEQFVFPSVIWVARQPDGSRFDESVGRHPDRTTQSAADTEDFLQEVGREHGFDVAIVRNGLLYGPDGDHTRMYAESLLSGDLPVVGQGLLGRGDTAVSLIHADDAAQALAAAIEAGLDGTYHAVDDEPVTTADYFSTFADLLDAPEPSRVPWWLARPLAGKDAVRFLTRPFPTTNDRLRSATDWEPTYPTYREGLVQIVETWESDGTLADLRGETGESTDENADTASVGTSA